ncbi:MAG: ion transporter [Myxococcales bacterium]|nr:ion transporter [Myxococcales bacterium]
MSANSGSRPTNSARDGADRVHSLFNPVAALPGDDWPQWRTRINTVIFSANSRSGSLFDWLLVVLIALSVGVVLLESITDIRAQWGDTLRIIEWVLTLAFTLEYVLRLATVKRPGAYALTFFGLVDLLSLLPTWLSLVFAGTQVLAVIRVLRMLRVFRLLQVSHFAGEAEVLAEALVASATRITVFLAAVLTIVVIMGSVMYLVEGEPAGFDSIPRGIYWAIVTLTTVGYGDIAPKTAFGQSIAAAVMVLGYAIIAVPTGIVSVELGRSGAAKPASKPETSCSRCGLTPHDTDARYCKQCGERLPSRSTD